MPADAKEITDAQWRAARDAASQGKVIQADADGLPVAVAPVLSLAELKAAQITTLSAACQAQIYTGFTSSALGTAHTYPAKDKDQVNLSGSVVASLLPGLPPTWKTPFWCADSTGTWAFTDHTAAQIQQVGSDAKAAILEALTRNATLAAQVMDPATDTAGKVAVIVW
jgi:hypothetical protein